MEPSLKNSLAWNSSWKLANLSIESIKIEVPYFHEFAYAHMNLFVSNKFSIKSREVRFSFVYINKTQITARDMTSQSAIGLSCRQTHGKIAHLLNYYIKAMDHKFLWFRGWLTTRDVGRTLKEFVNNSPAARDLQILLAFYQHPAWFISL